MMDEMTAAILYGKEDLRLERVAVPHAGLGELVVRVEAALTCGTDLKVYRRGYHAKMLQPPILFGHEVAGTVVEAGEVECLQGRVQQCRMQQVPAAASRPGGHVGQRGLGEDVAVCELIARIVIADYRRGRVGERL